MLRRTFIHALAATSGAGVIGLAATEQKAVRENASLEWTVKGFSCVTCAVGLETVLRRTEGIASVSAQYPSGRVRVGFDSNVISPQTIAGLIEEMGFQVAS